MEIDMVSLIWRAIGSPPPHCKFAPYLCSKSLPAHPDDAHSSGGQTAVGVLAWWMMAMILFPETQRRAHEELDRVVGRDRLPTFDDCDKLPYIHAMVRLSLHDF